MPPITILVIRPWLPNMLSSRAHVHHCLLPCCADWTAPDTLRGGILGRNKLLRVLFPSPYQSSEVKESHTCTNTHSRARMRTRTHARSYDLGAGCGVRCCGLQGSQCAHRLKASHAAPRTRAPHCCQLQARTAWIIRLACFGMADASAIRTSPYVCARAA